MLEEKVIRRFWDKVEKSGNYECWNWLGAMSWNGYGNMNIGGKSVLSAHRISYIIEFGEIPNGLVVMHICDNRKCVNPNHLRARSSKENAHDMLWKGRRKSTKRKVESHQ